MKYLIPNFAFEDELSQPATSHSPATLRAVHELSPLLGLAALPNDRIIVGREGVPDGVPDCLQHVQFVTESQVERLDDGDIIVPWGWSSRVRATALALGMKSDCIPEIAAVHEVNSRAFNAKFDLVIGLDSREQPFGDGFGRLCHSMVDVQHVIQQLQANGYERWVAKPQISHAGRNRLLVIGNDLNAQQSGWLNKRLIEGVYVEPWVKLLDEFSLQFDVPSVNFDCPRPQLLGATQLLNDSVGRYAGNLLLSADIPAQLQPIVDHGMQVCQAAQSAGYFGPIGIDCFRFRDANGNEGFRACNDINARYTMGRLAIHLRNHISGGETGAWCQFAQRNTSITPDEVSDPAERARKHLAGSGRESVGIIRTSPLSVGGVPVRTTTLFLTGSSATEILESQKLLHHGY